MQQVVTQLLSLLSQVPAPLVYLIAALWVGLESAGIGLPIEPMMLFVGSLAAQRTINLPLAILVLATGCLVFASLAYLIGMRAGTATIAQVGRFVGLTKVRADHIELWLRERGALGVFGARLTPIVRTFGSFVMGAADIPARTFALGTFAGALVYCGAWTIGGYVLGERYKAVLGAFDRYKGLGLLGLVVIIVAVALAHHFWGRLSLKRMAHYFSHHQSKRKTPIMPSSHPV
ncbi:MAG: DedA family protein [Ktedonobacterales bacterium]|nr:DedA family protein [Ktedonobacterales bacterium]